MANSEQKIDKTIVLDSCVDGDETRFNNLIGKHYDTFNIIYGVIKQNNDILDNSRVQCVYESDDMLKVTIPTKTPNTSDIILPQHDTVESLIEGGCLILNITVKKEW